MARKKAEASPDAAVEHIEQKTAELVALCEALKEHNPGAASAANAAQTCYAEAASWAVKAANA
jgi:hypothetical protein